MPRTQPAPLAYHFRAEGRPRVFIAMAVASTAVKSPIEYRFGRFLLIPAAHELWKDGSLCHTSPLVFGCLVYLLEQRQRMVGRDELVSAIWGRVDVADQQVRQLVQRARQTVDDDAKRQEVIRTVSGSGYRWVMAVETVEAPLEPASPTAPPADETPPSDAAPQAAVEAPLPAAGTDTPPENEAPGVAASPIRNSGRFPLRSAIFAASLAFLAATAVLLFFQARGNRQPERPAKAAVAPHAVAVLPFDVSGPDEAGWARLGAMDLVAQRLRSAGMPVPPSDSIVAAVHAVGEPNTPEHLARLRETLGAATLVQGTVAKSAGGWMVDLSAVAEDGLRRAAQAERPDAMEAARDAADLLLAALGETAPAGEIGRDDLDRLLQRARAALLGNQIDAARSILAGAPEALRSDPRLRVLGAQLDQRAGRLAESEASLRTLLADPAIETDAETHADALTTLGYLELNRNDCAAAERNFDAALGALKVHDSGRYGSILSTRAAALACLDRPDAAVKDLSAAGPLLDAAGDRLGRAKLNNHFGAVELYRGRPAQAAAYLRTALAIHRSFGAVDGARADLGLLSMAYAYLRQWPAALEASESLWALREHVRDAGALASMAGLRARVLIRTGSYREAETLLQSLETNRPEGLHAPFALEYHEARAELAWARGEPAQAIAAVDAAWKILPPAQMRDDEDLYTILLRQRAAFSLGQPAPDETALGLQANVSGSAAPVPLLVARAERDGRLGRTSEAEAAFRQAMANAESRDVPAVTVLAADAYARWLLTRQRIDEARAVAGRIAPWADRDFDSAMLQVAVSHAAGHSVALSGALRRAKALAGERVVPDALTAGP